MKFRLAYSVATPDSVANGDYQWRGFLLKTCQIPHRNNMPKNPHLFTFSECIEILISLKGYESPQANQYSRKGFTWLTVSDWEGCEKDYNYKVSMHFPDNISDSTKERVLSS